MAFATPWTSVEAAGKKRPAPAAAAEERAVVDKIIIQGNRKIELEAIQSKLVSKVGEPYSQANVKQDLKALFDTGFFYDIVIDLDKISNQKVALVYKVVEKPTIVSIEYDGNDEVSDDDLAETSGLKAYQILNNTTIQEAVEKIEKTYEDKGFFLAKVYPKIIDVKKDETVDVKFEVVENAKVQVKEIKFLGNKKLDSAKLKMALLTKEGGFFSFLSGSGAYKQDAFDRDMQILNYLYFNEGFVQVKIDRPQVSISPDKKGIYISIRLEEGEQFNIGQVAFSGDLLFDEDDLLKTVSIHKGELFSYDKMQQDIRALTAKYGDLGYAYANPIPRTAVNEKDRIVDVTFEIDKGNKVYIGKINVKGNTKTRDKVVRRELQIREGELYNETRKRESLDNVKRLGYFDEVNFHTKTPQNHPEIMDIDIVVKERNTGSIQLGAGYSSYDGFVVNGQINQINLLGRGQKLGASIDWADRRKNLTASFTEPYFLDTEWEVGFDAYQRDRTLPEYVEKKLGGSVQVGHPLAPYLNGIISYKLDDTKLTLPDKNSDPTLFPVETANGITSSVTLSLVYDKRDDRFAPTTGIYNRTFVEYAGLGGDLNYTKGGVNFRYYKKLFWEMVWRNNINFEFASPNQGDDTVPFNILSLLGGANTLRGYDWFSVGRKKFSQVAKDNAVTVGSPDPDTDALRPFGGRQEFYYNLEFQFPLIKEAGILGVLFYDVGCAENSIQFASFKSDVGFGFRWFSPIGPLRFEWGFALNPEEKFGEDSAGKFMFSIGSPF